MEKRIAILVLLVQKREATAAFNRMLHESCVWIIGRMGIPHRERCSVITVVMDCPADTAHALSGALGRLDNVQVSALDAG